MAATLEVHELVELKRATSGFAERFRNHPTLRRRHPLRSRDYCNPGIRGKALMESGGEIVIGA